MTTEDKVRSLTRNEIKVLYWKCKGYQYKEIALRYDRSVKWVEGLMTSVYRRLEVTEQSTAQGLMEYLKNEVCDIVQGLIGENEENLERWPLYGMTVFEQEDGTVIYVEKDKPDPEIPPDPLIIALVIYDQGAEDREAERRRKERRIRDILRQKAEARRREEEQKKYEEERKKREEEARNRQKQPINIDEPKRLPGPSGCRREVFIPLGIFLLLCGILVAGYIALTNIESPFATPASGFYPTPKDTSAPENTLTPTISLSPTISPTPIPLPIREDFSKQYSDLWQVIGNPVVSEQGYMSDYRGVLTVGPNETAKLLIGNTAWTNYRVSTQYTWGAVMRIGVRAKDFNNMIALSCNAGLRCDWVFMVDGVEDTLPVFHLMWTAPLIITVEGEKIIALGQQGNNTETMSVIIPPKYKDKFTGGGVFLQISDRVSVDYINIDPLP